jgi:hypothetical protein
MPDEYFNNPIHQHSYSELIDIDREYIEEYHLMNDDDVFVKLTKKQYKEKIVDTLSRIEFNLRVFQEKL